MYQTTISTEVPDSVIEMEARLTKAYKGVGYQKFFENRIEADEPPVLLFKYNSNDSEDNLTADIAEGLHRAGFQLAGQDIDFDGSRAEVFVVGWSNIRDYDRALNKARLARSNNCLTVIVLPAPLVPSDQEERYELLLNRITFV